MKWIDCCGHGIDTFIGTFNHYTNGGLQIYDVYIFPTSCGDELCLRYGNAPSEYASPGQLLGFNGNTNEVYRKAMELIRKNGMVKYVRNTGGCI